MIFKCNASILELEMRLYHNVLIVIGYFDKPQYFEYRPQGLLYRYWQECLPFYSNIQGIHKRKFERFANKILGINPKAYLKINRFRKSLYALLNTDYNTLAEVAYNCGYYDQMHFIKEFKLFTGSSPTQFLVEKKSLRQICFFS